LDEVFTGYRFLQGTGPLSGDKSIQPESAFPIFMPTWVDTYSTIKTGEMFDEERDLRLGKIIAIILRSIDLVSSTNKN